MRDQGNYGPGSIAVSNCGFSKATAKFVETALQEVLKKEDIANPKNVEQIPLWKTNGAGIVQGLGPYVVAVRAMPLPLPQSWKINKKTTLRSRKPKTGKTSKKLKPKSKKPLVKKINSHQGQPTMQKFFKQTS